MEQISRLSIYVKLYWARSNRKINIKKISENIQTKRIKAQKGWAYPRKI